MTLGAGPCTAAGEGCHAGAIVGTCRWRGGFGALRCEPLRQRLGAAGDETQHWPTGPMLRYDDASHKKRRRAVTGWHDDVVQGRYAAAPGGRSWCASTAGRSRPDSAGDARSRLLLGAGERKRGVPSQRLAPGGRLSRPRLERGAHIPSAGPCSWRQLDGTKVVDLVEADLCLDLLWGSWLSSDRVG